MAYVSLYRRFRPQTFDKVIGQGHITRTLGNQLKSGNISHAYLFTGSRGTGKTSVAKIFARAVNCLHPLADGSPCGECEICRELSNPANLDILEIDAASNNGVDEIRNLRDNVKYMPAVAKYKVYIVDEVHMLSAAAFNALLKTLEEPPEHVIFILATTEVQKIPATILSRCMRFDFRLLTIDELVKLLMNAFEGVGRKYEHDALVALAQAGQGSARDTLSLADMCVSYCEGEITYDQVIDALGICSPELILNMTAHILQGDVDSALHELNDMYKQGKSIGGISREIAGMLSNISYAKNCVGANSFLKLTADMYGRVRKVAESAENAKILHAMEVFCYLDGELRYSSLPKVLLEMAVIKACEISSDFTQDGILKRIKALEERANKGFALAAGDNAEESVSAPTLNGDKIWGEIIHEVIRENASVRVLLDSYTPSCELKENVLYAYFADENTCKVIQTVSDIIFEAIKRRYPDINELKILSGTARTQTDMEIEKIKNLVGENRVFVTGGNSNG